MLVPLYETVFDRLEVGAGTRMLALDCGSGLALLLASARGAAVTGCEEDESRLALARRRLLPGPACAPQPALAGPRRARLLSGPAEALDESLDDDVRYGAYDLVTALDPAAAPDRLRPALAAVADRAPRGTPVVLAGWGPPERCATSRVLAVAARLAEPRGAGGTSSRLSGRDDLEDLARAAGLRPDGSGRVSCPFGYCGPASAVRGLMSTGLFDAAVEATDRQQVEKEIAEALHPYRRPDGTVRMENVFRYLVARA
jgi:SAM-dependent methyltransferase